MIQRRLEIFIDKAWHDITGLYLENTYTLTKRAMNQERKSAVSSCSFTLRFDQELHEAIQNSVEPISVKVYRNGEIEFEGQTDPVLDTSWLIPEKADDMQIECVDFSIKLDDRIGQSASYPAAVDGPAFYIYKRDNKEMSLLYRILEVAGLSNRIDKNAPDIDIRIRHFAWTKNETTYRELIDGLLSDHLWCIKTDGDSISWFRTAFAEFSYPDEISKDDIIGNISKRKAYNPSTGVNIIWPRVKVMEDSLLWRGNLPVGDTANPRPGEPIAGGDYWPEDSDIVETWQEYGTEYLDIDYLNGSNRLKNSELALISSSNWYIKDKKDDTVSLDPIDGQEAIFEALRARFRYKNNGESAARLYWSSLYGKALVKYQEMNTAFPENCTSPEDYKSSYIYEKDHAERLVKGRWMFLSKGCFTFSFKSSLRLDTGEVYRLSQRPLYDGYVQIESVTIGSDSKSGQMFSYSAVSTAPFLEIESTTTGKDQSGAEAPGQNGSSPRFIYIRSYNKPATPVGENPDGWTFDIIPEGYKPVWMSTGYFESTGNLIGPWTEPIRVEGAENGGYRGATSSFPKDPLNDDFILYTGPSTSEFKQYHIYKYVAADDIWVETIESDKVMLCQKDALQIAKDTGTLIYAAMIFVELLVARKLMVGGGTLTEGLLVRFMDDDGNGNTIIEARYNGNKVWWIDVDTGKMYGNFAEVIQYLPYTFQDSFDSEHPAYFDFYIPDGIIENVTIRIKCQPYRTYSSVGSDTSFEIGYPRIYTTKEYIDLSHDHTFKGEGGTSDYSNRDGIHSHDVIVGSYPDSMSGSTTGFDDGRHSHSVSISGSTNKASFDLWIDVPYGVGINHYHNTDISIEEHNRPSSVTVSWSNGDDNYKETLRLSSGASANLAIKTSGWKTLKIGTSALGRVQAQVICKMRIDTTIV